MKNKKNPIIVWSNFQPTKLPDIGTNIFLLRKGKAKKDVCPTCGTEIFMVLGLASGSGVAQGIRLRCDHYCPDVIIDMNLYEWADAIIYKRSEEEKKMNKWQNFDPAQPPDGSIKVRKKTDKRVLWCQNCQCKNFKIINWNIKTGEVILECANSRCSGRAFRRQELAYANYQYIKGAI
jgi:hypothetical protein